MATMLAEIATREGSTGGINVVYKDRRWRQRWNATSRRKKTIVGALVAGSLAIAGGGTAIGVALTGSAPVTDRSSARCYSEVSHDFGPDFPGTTVGVAYGSDGSGGQVTAPVQLCASLWQSGELGAGGPAANGTAPQLTGCVLPNGIAAVFPGPPSVCQDLGLPAAALPG
jgi:hypothetical protein